ncbi:hypothetical protein DBIPINDM_002941 [Mesorhizobium sp. AR02]|uniref:hypothetical protein n=1 Tax=Mesorhizobium sp. AR02 TaxID=2865837 RepID=UPI00215EEAE7|nr:hypothetical protein [Mesorhizobium sp. AR02]UVK56344.1 hypothetical protein DBIPINDM_002941 [Mesorhizobium sp. AR02]
MQPANFVSLIGQLLDLGGFGLGAWDLLPRYVIDQEIRRLKKAMATLECINVQSRRDGHTPFYVNDREKLTAEGIRAWRRYKWYVPESVEKGWRKIKVLEEEQVAPMLPKINQMIGQRMMMLEQHDDRPHPPLALSVALIVVGSALQVGATAYQAFL